MSDPIERQAAKEAYCKKFCHPGVLCPDSGFCREVDEAFDPVPSAQPTLCGYDIEHLILIANVLRKENLPPERVIEALTDIGRIVSIVTDEFKESLRKAVEQCKI